MVHPFLTKFGFQSGCSALRGRPPVTPFPFRSATLLFVVKGRRSADPWSYWRMVIRIRITPSLLCQLPIEGSTSRSHQNPLKRRNGPRLLFHEIILDSKNSASVVPCFHTSTLLHSALERQICRRTCSWGPKAFPKTLHSRHTAIGSTWTDQLPFRPFRRRHRFQLPTRSAPCITRCTRVFTTVYFTADTKLNSLLPTVPSLQFSKASLAKDDLSKPIIRYGIQSTCQLAYKLPETVTILSK